MARASIKKLAQANSKALNQLHAVSIVVFVATAGVNLLFGRRLRLFCFMSAPAVGIEVLLERLSRPTWHNSQLVRAGDDLSQKGLTEYMLDVIYWTWICQIASSLLGPQAWWLYLLIPLFAVYLAFSLLRTGRKLFSPGQEAAGEPPVSKRQEKLQKRQAKYQ